MSSLNKAEKFWNRLANQFDKLSKHLGMPPSEKAKKFLNVNDIVLDFGCATGTVTIELSDYVKEIKGIDISSRMIDVAKRKVSEVNIKNIDFIQATINDERLKIDSFHVIIAFNILHFFQDTQNVLKRINKLLKPGGLIIIATACVGQRTFSNSLQYLLFSPLIKLGIIPYMKFFKTSELKDSIESGNFEIIELVDLDSPTNYFIVAKKPY
jgi:2-polyprenyl-3-methyl-5-hydroxy-6-metoxy-1,4-benzoquinol methylase